MPRYEYLTVPAPRKGEKNKGAKTPEARAAQAMQTLLNAQAAKGWEYLRADMLPMEERSGLTSKTVNYQTILVFRREIDAEDATEGRADFGAFPDTALEDETATSPAPKAAPRAEKTDKVPGFKSAPAVTADATQNGDETPDER